MRFFDFIIFPVFLYKKFENLSYHKIFAFAATLIFWSNSLREGPETIYDHKIRVSFVHECFSQSNYHFSKRSLKINCYDNAKPGGQLKKGVSPFDNIIKYSHIYELTDTRWVSEKYKPNHTYPGRQSTIGIQENS